MSELMSSQAKWPLNGLLLLDKPTGLTSHAACDRVRRRFDLRKVGHLGTLDPLATGLLPIAVGEAVKYAGYGLLADKSYAVTVRLGVTTTTDDIDGEVVSERPLAGLNTQAINALMDRYLGTIDQVPPRYCALKYRGRPYYDWARRGQDIPRPARSVTITAIRLCAIRGQELDLEVDCSKGTYIRALARDLGEDWGCGGCVSRLRRLSVSPWVNPTMVTLSALETMTGAALSECLLPVDSLFPHLPTLQVGEVAERHLRQGRVVACLPVAPPESLVCLRGYDQRFFGLGKMMSDCRCKGHRLLADLG